MIIYSFFGIQLATQNYVNPAIDIIKKKGVLGSETMNVTLLAMSNSAAESFIIVNSIFFGVSDIGISTVVQQAAFYSLINQGKFDDASRFGPLFVLKKIFSDWDPALLGFRYVLLDRRRGYVYRLVDYHTRDRVYSTLLVSNLFFPVR